MKSFEKAIEDARRRLRTLAEEQRRAVDEIASLEQFVREGERLLETYRSNPPDRELPSAEIPLNPPAQPAFKPKQTAISRTHQHREILSHVHDIIARLGPRPITELYSALPPELRNSLEDGTEAPVARLRRLLRRNAEFVLESRGQAVSLKSAPAPAPDQPVYEVDELVRTSDGELHSFVVKTPEGTPSFIEPRDMRTVLADGAVVLLPEIAGRRSRLILFDNGFRSAFNGRLNRDLWLVSRRFLAEEEDDGP